MPDLYRLKRAILKVSGPDAVGFLDNLLTQSVAALKTAGALYAALLTPQGKVMTDMLLWDGDDGVLAVTAPSQGAEFLAKLSMYKLRAAVTLEDVSDRLAVYWRAAPFDGARPDPRLPDGALGWLRIGAAQDAPDGTLPYNAHRLRIGAPDLEQDAAREEVFALEALLEELHGVDFAKGCFVGQENVSRMKRRATTRRKFCPIRFAGDAPAPFTPLTAGPAEIGSVRSGVRGRAMALVRLDRAAEAQAKGEPLQANGAAVELDPPSWLIRPEN